MNILITTGIYPPAIGGPATYTHELVSLLRQRGHKVRVVAYADKSAHGDDEVRFVSRGANVLQRYRKATAAIRSWTNWADIVYAHDLVSIGLPSALAIRNTKAKLVVRLGGDFLWEKAFNAGWTDVPLEKYHAQPKSLKEKIYLAVYRYVLRRCSHVIFSTKWQQKMYEKPFGESIARSSVVENAFPAVLKRTNLGNSELLFAGRFIRLKNISALIRAVASVEGAQLRLSGDGPEKNTLRRLIVELDLHDRVHIEPKMSHAELFTYIENAHAVVVPSVSDISPNLAYEAIARGVPVLLPQSCGYKDKLSEQVLFVDTTDQESLVNSIRDLYTETKYEKYLQQITEIETKWGWDDIADAHEKLFTELI